MTDQQEKLTRASPPDAGKPPIPWMPLAAGLIIFTFLLYLARDHFEPLLLGLLGIIILYPYRRETIGRILILLITFPVVVSLTWRLRGLIIPFLVALVLAYALNPIVDWLVARRIPRGAVIALLTLASIGVVAGAALLILPVLFTQVTDLVSAVPIWLEAATNWATKSVIPLLGKWGLPLESIQARLQANLPSLFQSTMQRLAWLGSNAFNILTALLTGLANLLLIPILTIYFLLEFRRIRSRAYRLFPEPQRPLALRAYNALNSVLSAYFRGQMLVVIFLASWISLGLWLVAGVPYALLLGLTAGILNLMPYLGATVALIITIIISLFQPHPFITSLKALAVFWSAQAIEGNLITPRLVGDKVGLHPLVVIFAVLAAGALFGFFGLLLAIPVCASAAAVMKVLLLTDNACSNRLRAPLKLENAPADD